MAKIRTGLMREIITMSFDTLRSSKMRSALTVLGVVIGITSIVGMTSLIRGFDESLRDLFRELGPNTITVQKFGLISFSSGKSFLEVARRPNLSMDDAKAIARECPSVAIIDVWLGGGPGNQQPRMFYGSEKTKPMPILGATENFAAVNFVKLETGRFFLPTEVDHRKQVVVLGQGPARALFPSVAIVARIDSSNPRIRDVMPTMAVMPMTTPSTVRPERSLLVRTVSKAMTMTSLTSPYRICGVFIL